MDSESESQNSIYLKTLNDQLQHYGTILDLADKDYPSIEQQLRWLEKSNLKTVHFLNERDLAVFNDTSLEGLLTEYSISQQEYESNISPTEGYITFRDFDLLNSKGCQVKDVPESYQRIFGLIKEKFGIVKPADIKEPITLQNGRYSLVTVRDNKSRIDNNKRSQKMWYLFVKFSNDPIE